MAYYVCIKPAQLSLMRASNVLLHCLKQIRTNTLSQSSSALYFVSNGKGKSLILSGSRCPPCRFFSSGHSVRSERNPHNRNEKAGQLTTRRSPSEAPTVSTAQKVKEAGKDFTYLIVILVGLGVTGGLFYVVFKELFSSSSPSKIYGVALEKCRAHPEVIGVFGEPIKGYGETTRRGRRQHVSHVEYMKDGVKHMRLKFYIQGSEPRVEGTVHLEVKENPTSGKFEFCFIFVDIDTYPRRSIVIEDNR
uniref:Mitochondrial import inner membrane translocase subunit Tim21 n=1 Tax=Erpetoichthys calabaricus TaxID=27687 RepID=A0A8C4X5G8_ERPCA